MDDRVPDEPPVGSARGLFQSIAQIPSRIRGVFKRDVQVTSKDVEVTSKDVEVTPRDVEVTPREVNVTSKDINLTSKDVQVDAVSEASQIFPDVDPVIGNSLDHFDREVVTRWDTIANALAKCEITHDSDPLQDVISSYNSPYDCHFDALYNFSVGDQRGLFKTVTPKIIALALSLPQNVWLSPPRLQQGVAGEVAFTQREIAALLANAFLCTFPPRDRFGKLPDVNFDQLFQDDSVRKQEKLKCIFNYFDRVGSCSSENVVTYKRLVVNIDDMPRWRKSATKLGGLVVSSSGSIEKDGAEMLQVDFANKYVGGGVLGNGLVQEEIRFVTNPELIAARLFAEVLLDNEALLMIGSECYSKYTGYSDSFRFAGSHVDSTPLDERRRRKCAIVAIDATRFRRHETSLQFESRSILRETNKAYVGFLADGFDRSVPVATGNWGCGAFNGDPRLKALLQLMAASEAGRALHYFTYGDHDLAEDIEETYRMLVHHGVTVGDLFKKIGQYRPSTWCSLYQTLRDWLEPQQEFVADYSQRGLNADVPQYGNNADVSQYGNNADVPQYGNNADVPQYGINADVPQYGNNADVPQYGNNADVPQYGNNADVSQYGINTDVSQYGNNADVSQYGNNADVSQYGNNADVPQYELNADQMQHGLNSDNSQVKLTDKESQLDETDSAKSSFEPEIETSPRTSTCTKDVADRVEVMGSSAGGAKVVSDATEDEDSSKGECDGHRNAELHEGTVGDLVVVPQISSENAKAGAPSICLWEKIELPENPVVNEIETPVLASENDATSHVRATSLVPDGTVSDLVVVPQISSEYPNRDAHLICLRDNIELPDNAVVNEIETPVLASEDATSHVGAGVCADFQEAMDVDDDPGSANDAEEREGVHLVRTEFVGDEGAQHDPMEE